MFLRIKFLVHLSKWRVEQGVCEVISFFPVPEEIAYSFLVYFGIAQFWLMYHSLDRRVWFTIIFLPLKESLTMFQVWIGFVWYTFTYFVPFGVIENRVTKVNSKYLNENCDHFFCPGWSILFYMYQPVRLDFLKSLSLIQMHLHIVLKSLVSY